MFLTFDDEKCPVCGTLGENVRNEEMRNCPNCSTKFNEFGIIFTENPSIDLHWS